jgi:ribosome-associated protein
VSDPEDDDAELRSRSDVGRRRKAAEKRLAELAKALVDLPKKQLAKLQLEGGLLDAVVEGRRITAHSALARQMRIVRRELRDSDAAAIASAVDDLVNPRGRPTAAAREAQIWVDRFIAEGDEVVEVFVAQHQRADRQRLKMLVRNARKASPAKAPKARKTVKQSVQSIIEEASNSETPPLPDDAVDAQSDDAD